MKIHKLIPILCAAAVSLLGCVTVEQQYIEPLYDQSHAMLIERTVAELAIADLVKSFVRPNEKVVIGNIENTTTDERVNVAYSEGERKLKTNLDYIIQDQFILNLSKAGYKVLERDEDMIIRLMPEQGASYKRNLLRRLPKDPSIVLMDAIDAEGLKYVDPVNIQEVEKISTKENQTLNLKVDRVNLPDIISFYREMKTDYAGLEKDVRMASADVMIAYRILECGIIYEPEQKKEKMIDPETGKQKVGGKELWTLHFGREALARVYVRVMDAKTGEIRTATVLRKDNADTVTFQQGEFESLTAFNLRIRKYEEMLKAYHYTFYEHQLPSMKAALGEQETQISKGVDTTKLKKVNWLPWAIGGAGGLSLIAILAIAFSGM
jgi:hypothetical protein